MREANSSFVHDKYIYYFVSTVLIWIYISFCYQIQKNGPKVAELLNDILYNWVSSILPI